MKRRISSFLRTALAMFLCLLMLAGVLPAQAYFVTDGEGDIVPTAPGDLILTNSEGETVETSESWESAFPYGAFAFENASLTVSEGEEAVLKVYRLGGTTGRATAVITYQPVVIVGEDGEAVFQYGISADDIVLSVEEPQPIALYQPVGRPPEPARGDAAVTVTGTLSKREDEDVKLSADTVIALKSDGEYKAPEKQEKKSASGKLYIKVPSVDEEKYPDIAKVKAILSVYYDEFSKTAAIIYSEEDKKYYKTSSPVTVTDGLIAYLKTLCGSENVI